MWFRATHPAMEKRVQRRRRYAERAATPYFLCRFFADPLFVFLVFWIPEFLAGRPADIVGDLGEPGPILADWGRHLVDMNLAMGNLIDLVRLQSKAWRSAH